MRTNHAFMKKLQQSDSSNSNYPLHHQKKYLFKELEDFRRLNLQSTPNSNGHRSNSSNSRKTKFTNREKSTSANKMHKSNQSPSLKSCQEDIANNSSSSNKIPAISTPGIKLQKISTFSYPRRIVLPFSERVMENNNLPTYSSSNISPSVQSNRYSFESSWSNLWRSGLPEQKLTVWLPRRFTDQEDERSQCKLNIFSPSNIKLHKHSFPDLNVKELDNPSIWKSTQKCSPQKFSNSSSYWTPNSHLNGYNSTNDNHSSSGSTNNLKIPNTFPRNEDVSSNHSVSTNKLTIMGNSYPVKRPPDIKEKTLAQLALIRKEENCKTSIDSVTNTKGYMDPIVGAPVEFLNRVNELSKLQEATKRWERTRYRRRVKRKTVQTLNQSDS